MGNYLCPCLKEYHGCCADFSVNRSGIKINVIEATTTVPMRTPTESLSGEPTGANALAQHQPQHQQCSDNKRKQVPTADMLRRQIQAKQANLMKASDHSNLIAPEPNVFVVLDAVPAASNLAPISDAHSQNVANYGLAAAKVTGMALVTYSPPTPAPVLGNKPSMGSAQAMLNGTGKLFYRSGGSSTFSTEDETGKHASLPTAIINNALLDKCSSRDNKTG